MRIKTVKKRRDFPIIFLKIALIVAVLGLCVKAFDTRIRPTVMKTLLISARAETLSALNEAVRETLLNSQINIADSVTIEKNDNGQITAIKTDTLLVNLFQTNISEGLNLALKQFIIKERGIPIGSLSGMVLFNGRGAKIPFRISPLSQVKTELESEFLSAGINQTIHKINLKVTVSVSAVIPGFETSTTVSADYCIAQTVIVGEVPQLMLGSHAFK